MKFTGQVDLASARVGGRALQASDDFFASRHNLLRPEPAIFIPGRYTSRGKWMDGWESRRKRTPGHDWCLVKLGLRGIVHGVDIDTSFFNGNQPEKASIEACDLRVITASEHRLRRAEWAELLPPSVTLPAQSNLYAVRETPHPVTHLRLNIFPDGGVARLRVYGVVAVDWSKLRGKLVDLAAVENGGRALAASDEHFGRMGNLLFRGRAVNMGDGWETRRRRGPGHDWVTIALGHRGTIDKIEIDTNHFKGNYPDRASIQACYVPHGVPPEGDADGAPWTEILPETKLRAHHRRVLSRELKERGPFTHVRLRIFPDGGVSRLRVYGRALLV